LICLIACSIYIHITDSSSNAEIVESAWPGITTVIQFPSRAKLDEFYNSAESEKASEFRNKVAISKIALVEQFTWPPAVGSYFGRGGISHQN